MKKTNAQLLAELEAKEQELEAARQQLEAAAQRPPRDRYGFGVWPNLQRRNERDPAWRGTVRLTIPEHTKPGDPLWVDFSEWEYDPETSPVRYADNPPVFSGSLSPCPPARAKELEKRRADALRERGQLI